MKRFDVIDLTNPETYRQNQDLEKFSRHYARDHFRQLGYETRAQAREAVLSGRHAELIASAWDAVVRGHVAADEQRRQHMDTAANVKLPDGYSLRINGDQILLSGPYNAELPARMKRQGGVWDCEGQIWVLPLSSVAALPRIFKNAARKAKANQADRTLSDLNRWLGYIESKAADGWVYEKGRQKLIELGIHNHPELSERLNAAMATAARIKSEQQAARKKESDEHARQQAERRTNRILYPIKNLPATNRPTRLRGGRVVVFESTGKKFFINEDHPSYEGSHLLGHEGEYGCYCYYRVASSEEVAALEHQETARNLERERQAERQAAIALIRETIQKNGELPAGKTSPEGHRYIDTHNIHGSGDWFVVGADWIWYVKNNGLHGDDWSRNNVLTGGAGAIGWRIHYNDALAKNIMELDNETS